MPIRKRFESRHKSFKDKEGQPLTFSQIVAKICINMPSTVLVKKTKDENITMAAKLEYALKGGKYVSVNNFEPKVGLKCGCICPECGNEVGSKIFKNEEKINHFFHFNETNCSGGDKETELHLFAKKVLEESNGILLPLKKKKE